MGHPASGPAGYEGWSGAYAWVLSELHPAGPPQAPFSGVGGYGVKQKSPYEGD